MAVIVAGGDPFSYGPYGHTVLPSGLADGLSAFRGSGRLREDLTDDFVAFRDGLSGTLHFRPRPRHAWQQLIRKVAKVPDG